MNKKIPPFSNTSKGESELVHFRKQIDQIDDEIVNLLLERTSIVGQVGELKRRTAPGRCPIRPGREAEMIRRVMATVENSTTSPKLPPAAAAAIWRTLIGASANVEANLIISAFTPERESDLFWMAREYFGPFIQIIRQPYVKRVIGDVMDGKAAVGIVPMLRSSDTTFWWTNLTQQGNDMPTVFARVPFVYHGGPNRDSPSALAIARVNPENSGDDNSLLVLEADSSVSQNRLQTAFTTAKLEATWINIATLTPNARHHLIELKGFITEEHEGIQALLGTLGASIFNATFLGSYAVPIIIDNSKTSLPIKAGANAAGSS